MADWARYGLSQELEVVIVKSPGEKLGLTLSSYQDDVSHPRVSGTSDPTPCPLC